MKFTFWPFNGTEDLTAAGAEKALQKKIEELENRSLVKFEVMLITPDGKGNVTIYMHDYDLTNIEQLLRYSMGDGALVHDATVYNLRNTSKITIKQVT